MIGIPSVRESIEDLLLVLRSEVILVAYMGELCRGVDEMNGVVPLGLLENQDAGGDRGAKK
jgi:hypothetical protein